MRRSLLDADAMPASPPDLRIRAARERDVERLIDVHLTSFPDVRGREARRRNLCENARGALDDLLIVEQGGALVGHGFLFPMQTWIGGRPVAMGGVASVGVSPEARRQGVARALLRQMMQILRDRGAPLCMLYPFRVDFYRSLGWGFSGSQHRYRFVPQALELGPERSRVRVARGDDLRLLEQCYESYAASHNGLIRRSERVWRALLSPEGVRVVFVPPASAADPAAEGYVVFRLLPEADNRIVLDVVEQIARTDGARRALLGFLAAQSDQVARVHLCVAPDEALHTLLKDPRGPSAELVRGLWMVAADVVVGPMVRIVRVPAALEARGYAAGSGTLTLRVIDPWLEDNGGPWTVRWAEGEASVEAGVSRGAPQLTTDAASWAEIYMGTLTPSQAVRLGKASIEPASAVAQVDAWLRTDPPQTLDVF